MALNYAKTAVRLACTPVCALGRKIHRSAYQRSKFWDGDFLAAVQQHQATGTDFAANATRNFIALQFKLVPYRIMRVAEEAQAFGCAVRSFKVSDIGLKWIVGEGRFVARCMFLFMLGVIVGRNSVYPLLEPGSPFVKELQYRNPNRGL